MATHRGMVFCREVGAHGCIPVSVEWGKAERSKRRPPLPPRRSSVLYVPTLFLHILWNDSSVECGQTERVHRSVLGRRQFCKQRDN